MNPIDPLAFASRSAAAPAGPGPAPADHADVARFEAALANGGAADAAERAELDKAIREQVLRDILKDAQKQQQKLKDAIRGN